MRDDGGRAGDFGIAYFSQPNLYRYFSDHYRGGCVDCIPVV